MKYIFCGILIFLTIVLMLGIFLIRKNKSELKNILQMLLFVAAITQLSFVCAIFFTKPQVVNLSYGIYFASIDWLLFVLVKFTQRYTKLFDEVKAVYNTFLILAVLETISMSLNVLVGHVYELKEIYFMKERYLVPVNKTGFFSFHLILTYILVLIIIVAFTHKTICLPRFYKRKFYPVDICFVIIIVVNALYLFMGDIPLDISLIIYATLAVVICWNSLYKVPDGIINDMFSMVVMDYNDGIMCMDMDDNCIYINSIMSQYMWIPQEDTDKLNEYFREWKESEPHSKDDYYTWEQQEIIDGEERYYEHIYHKLYDKKGNYIGCYFALKDKSVTLEQLRKEKYYKTHDDLTGIYVAERFYEVTAERLAANMRKDWIVICSNIRDYKLFRDFYGNQTADELLCTQAKLIKENASPTSVYGRLGEDRFALCMEKSRFDLNIFKENMEKMIDAYRDKVYRMDIQMGIYEVKDHTESVQSMCNKAIFAMKFIANNYNEIAVRYEDSMMQNALDEKRIVSEFEDALASGQFHIYLQPKMIESGDMVGTEVHVRWMHPQRGLLFGKDFIPVLKKRGYMQQLCLYIWEQTALLLKKWKEQGLAEQIIMVKIYLGDYNYFNVADEIIRIMKKYDVDAKNVRIDVSEILWAEQFEEYIPDIKKLQEFGFELKEFEKVMEIRKDFDRIKDYGQPIPVREYEEKYVE